MIHLYTTAQIEAEIARRKALTPEGRVLERMSRSWCNARQITKRARIDPTTCKASLRRLCEERKAQYRVVGGRVFYRRAEAREGEGDGYFRMEEDRGA